MTVEQLVSEWDRIESLATDAPRFIPVPSCPQWTIADLVEHVGRVYRFFAEMIRSGRERPFPFSEIPGPAAGAEIEWAAVGLKELVAEIKSRAPGDYAWSWSADKTVAWVTRRLTHETLVHRWDLENALGVGGETNATLASDCIDEFITSFVLGRKTDSPLPSGSVHLHCTDTEGEWIAVVESGSIAVRREHAKGDVAVRGEAKSLALLLWRRLMLDDSDLEIFGDVNVAQEFVSYARL